jgi:hypothetical protein
MRKLCFAGAAVAFVLFVIHVSPWVYFADGARPLPVQVGVWLENEALKANGTHYFQLERELWTALFAGLVLAFLGEGLCRKRDREAELEDY